MPNRPGVQGGPTSCFGRAQLAGHVERLEVSPLLHRTVRPSRWHGMAFTGSGFVIIRAYRDVLLGADAPVTMAERAVRCLAKTREAVTATGQPGGTVVTRDGGDVPGGTGQPSGQRCPHRLSLRLDRREAALDTSGLPLPTPRSFSRRAVRSRAHQCSDLHRKGRVWFRGTMILSGEHGLGRAAITVVTGRRAERSPVHDQ